jgi:hypothetical protein
MVGLDQGQKRVEEIINIDMEQKSETLLYRCPGHPTQAHPGFRSLSTCRPALKSAWNSLQRVKLAGYEFVIPELAVAHG